MGAMPGYKQITLYIDPITYEQAAHVARMVGEPVYVFVNKALADSIKSRTTPDQRKAVDTLMSNGDKNERREERQSNARGLVSVSRGGTGATTQKRKDSRKGRASR